MNNIIDIVPSGIDGVYQVDTEKDDLIGEVQRLHKLSELHDARAFDYAVACGDVLIKIKAHGYKYTFDMAKLFLSIHLFKVFLGVKKVIFFIVCMQTTY